VKFTQASALIELALPLCKVHVLFGQIWVGLILNSTLRATNTGLAMLCTGLRVVEEE